MGQNIRICFLGHQLHLIGRFESHYGQLGLCSNEKEVFLRTKHGFRLPGCVKISYSTYSLYYHNNYQPDNNICLNIHSTTTNNSFLMGAFTDQRQHQHYNSRSLMRGLKLENRNPFPIKAINIRKQMRNHIIVK